MRSVFALALLAAGLASCYDSGTQYKGSFSVNTGKTAYSAGETIAVTIANQSSSVISVSTCCGTDPDFRLQRQVEADWTPAGFCELKCPSIPLKLSPNGSIVDTVQVAQPGRYRIMLRFSKGPVDLSGDSVYTNEFEVL